MSKNFRSVLCQKDLRPGYYDGFQCLMGGCRLNCCKGGWHINFGKKDYLTIKKQKGSPELNAGLDHCLQRIRENVDEQYRYGEFILQNGNCPLLRDGKCGLQLEKGDAIEHRTFGKGMVLSVRPMGGDALIEVAFDGVGTKKLMLKVAGAHITKL